MAAWSRKAFRCSTRAADKSSISLATPPPIFFNVRFPKNHMFTPANREDEDNIQNHESFAYDWIKSLQLQTSRSIVVRISACLELGLMDFRVSSWCAKSNASCIAPSRVRTFSSRSYCSRSFWHQNKHSISVFLPTITQTGAPRGWPKPGHMPSLQTGEAESESQLSRGEAERILDALPQPGLQCPSPI